MCVPADTPFFLGEMVDDAVTAELLALAWALCWSFEHGYAYGVPLLFRFDATGAGFGSFAAAQQVRYAQPERGLCLPAFVCVVRQALQSRASVAFEHVLGHSGVIGNELSDQLAKHARRCRQDCYLRCLPTWPAQWREHPLAAWGWLAHAAAGADVPSLPAFEAEARRLQLTKDTPVYPSLSVCQETGRPVRSSITFGS